MKSLHLELNLDTGKFTGRMKEAGRETERFERNVSGLNRELAKTDKAAKMTFGSLGAGVVVLGNLRSALENTRFFFTGLASAAVNASAEIEKTFHLLKGMSKASTSAGAIKEATGNLEYLMQKAREAPFSLQALTDGFVKMKAGGIDPLAGGFQSILDASAAFGANDEVLKRAFVAIQQMGGKGVVSMEELRQQLGEAIPTAINMMAEGLGVSYEQLVKQIESGKLRAGPALDAMFAKMKEVYGGKAIAMMQTYQGRVAELKSSLIELALAFTGMNIDGTVEEGSFYDTLKQSVVGITNAFRDPKFKESVASFGSSIATVASSLTTIVGLLGQVISFIPGLNNISFVMAAIAATIAMKLGGGIAAKVKAAFSDQESGLNKLIAKYKAREKAELDVLKADQSRASAAVKHSASRQAATEKEILGRQKIIAQIREEIVETQRLIAAQAGAASGRGAGGQFISRADRAAALNEQGRLTERLKNQQKELERNTVMLTNAQRENSKVSKALVADTLKLDSATSKATNGIRAMSRLSIVGGAALNGLRGLFAAMGGPWGLAIMGITAGVGILTTKMAEQRQAAADLTQRLEAKKQAYLESEAAANAARIETGNLTEEELAAATAAASLTGQQGLLADAYWRTAAAAKAAQLAMLEATAAEDEKDLNDAQKAYNRRLSQQEIRTRPAGSFGGPDGRQPMPAGLAEINRTVAVDSMADSKEAKELKTAQENAARSKQRYEAEKDKKLEDYVVTPTTTTSPLGDTKKTKEEVDEVAKALDNFRQRTTQIQEAMQGTATEAAKMAAHIGEGGKFENAAESVKKELMDAAVAMDRLLAAQKVAEHMEKMASEGADLARQGELLEAELAAVSARQSESSVASVKYRVQLEAAAKAAGVVLENIEETIDAMVKADARNRNIEKQIEVMGKVNDLVAEQRLAADEAWDDYISGAAASGRETKRLERQLNALYATLANDPAQLAIAQVAGAEAMQENARMVAANHMISMRKETESINIALSGLSQVKRDQIALDREAKIVWDELVAGTKAGTQERIEAEQQYANWKLAKEQEIRAKDPMTSMFLGWADVMGNMSQAFTGFTDQLLDGLLDGEMAFEDFAKSVVAQIAKIIIQAMIARMVLAAIGMNAPMQTTGPQILSMPQIPQLQELNTMLPSLVAHTGAIVGGQGNAGRTVSGSVFAGAMKYHTGGIAGLKPKEVPAILQEGEGVFTREQMAALAPVGAQAPNVRIEIINESGTPMDAQQSGGGPKFDGKEYIIGVVMDSLSKPGKMRDTMRGAMAGG